MHEQTSTEEVLVDHAPFVNSESRQWYTHHDIGSSYKGNINSQTSG
jgi:hypothetical protein